MNNELSNQLFMLMNLSFIKNDNNSIINYLIVITGLLPIINKLISTIYDYYNDYFNDEDKNIAKINFPVHQLKLTKDSHHNESRKVNVYSLNYLGLNNYILENLNNIEGLNTLIEIMNTDLGYYKDDTNEKNFILIPYNCDDIIIQKKNDIRLKITTNEINEEDKDDKKKKQQYNNNKSYDITIYIKCLPKDYQEKIKIIHNFINECKKNFLKKEEDSQINKQFIFKLNNIKNDEWDGVNVNFDRLLFKSNKFFNKNIYFEEQEKFYNYITKFKKNNFDYEEEFEKEGRTYKSIILLSGFPGTGKTSVINAILNETGRHGIVVPLSKIKTCDEFEKIFYTREIKKINYNPSELCIIFEDCDAFDDNVLYSRKKENDKDLEVLEDLNLVDKNKDKNKELLQYNILKNMNKDNNSINLSCILNVLDGVIELHGLMVIFTTNHPEKLDEAFLRKGRINYTLNFRRANKNIILKIIKNRFNLPKNFNINKYKLIDYVLSPAEIKEICGYNDNLPSCMKELEEETQKYKYRINDNSKIIIENSNINKKKIIKKIEN